MSGPRYGGRLSRHQLLGASLVELLVTVAILSLLAALILPAVMHVRRAAMASTCRLRLRDVGVALNAYEGMHQVFPGGGYDWSQRPSFFSIHTMLLPHLAEGNVYDRVNFAVGHFNHPDSRNPANSTAGGFRVAAFLCPADAGTLRAGPANSYRGNGGTLTYPVADGDTGAFALYRCLRVAEFTDGLSHTVMFGERLVGDGAEDRYDPSRDVWLLNLPISNEHPNAFYEKVCPGPPPTTAHASDPGTSWLDASVRHTLYVHVFPPNASVPDCGLSQSSLNVEGAVGARSGHAGIVHALLGDGAVRPVGDGIDRRRWTAMATRSGGEAIDGH